MFNRCDLVILYCMNIRFVNKLWSRLEIIIFIRTSKCIHNLADIYYIKFCHQVFYFATSKKMWWQKFATRLEKLFLSLRRQDQSIKVHVSILLMRKTMKMTLDYRESRYTMPRLPCKKCLPTYSNFEF